MGVHITIFHKIAIAIVLAGAIAMIVLMGKSIAADSAPPEHLSKKKSSYTHINVGAGAPRIRA